MKTLNVASSFWCPDLKVRDFGHLEITEDTTHISFTVDCDYFQLDHQLFIGFLESASCQHAAQGIGVLIDPENGEVLDMVNGEGVIGYLDEAPLESWKQPKISIEMEKIGPVFIPEIVIGTERILHPALHKSEVENLVAIAGSSSCYLGSHARFLAPRIAA